MTRARTAPRGVVATAALGVLLLCSGMVTGCGADAPTGRADEQESKRPRSLAERPGGTPSSAPASPSQPASQPPAGRRTVAPSTSPRPSGNALTFTEPGPDRHLLAATAFGRRWSVARTADEHGRVMSRCHAATMRDVGAEQTRLRDFSGPLQGATQGGSGAAQAVQAVSRFVDGRSAWRVEQVVAAWAEECARELRSRDAALGAVRHGAWLSVVEVAGVGRPHHRLQRALRAAEATF